MPSDTTKIARFFSAHVDPGNRDEVLSTLRAINERNRDQDEPGTEIQAFHFEEPDTLWVYALFSDQEAREYHRARNRADDAYRRAMSHLTLTVQAECVPLFAKGIDFD
jgi:hypothetical protein